MHLRLADASDVAALERMLLEAANWSPDRNQLTLQELQDNETRSSDTSKSGPGTTTPASSRRTMTVSWAQPGSDGSLGTDRGSAS